MSSLQMLTVSGDGTTWVDIVPKSSGDGGVLTGYQHQNTNITARNLGQADVTMKVTGGVGSQVLEVSATSGVIDVDGVPFVMLESVNFAQSQFPAGELNFIKVIEGDSITEKDLAISSELPVWSDIKQAYYTPGGDRVLNFSITSSSIRQLITVRPLLPSSTGLNTTSVTSTGIGRGETIRDVPQEQDTVQVAHAGYYSILAIGPGDTTTGYGGAAVYLEIFLDFGDIIVTATGQPSSPVVIKTAVSVANKFNMSIGVSDDITVNMLAPYTLKNENNGGAPYPVAFGAAGGGAGAEFAGESAFLIATILGAEIIVAGRSMIENFGQGGYSGGGTGSRAAQKGLIEIAWLSD